MQRISLLAAFVLARDRGDEGDYFKALTWKETLIESMNPVGLI
jgi:hypothetical protein